MLADAETFHPVVGPVAEAQALYVNQLRLRERLQNHAVGGCGVEQWGQTSTVSGSDNFCSTSASQGSGWIGDSRTQTINCHKPARNKNVMPNPATT